YTVMPADVQACQFANTALATAIAPDMSLVSDEDDETITLFNLPPFLTCPAPSTLPAAVGQCDRIVMGLEAAFSDPNGNVVTLTWVMNGATMDMSPLTGINQLDSHVFNVGITTVTYTVWDGQGASA